LRSDVNHAKSSVTTPTNEWWSK